MNGNVSEKLWELLAPAPISMACSLASTAYFTGQYVQQILSNTDRIIVLERRGGELQTILYSVKEDSAINRNNFQWIKEVLENERANQSNSRRSEGDSRRDPIGGDVHGVCQYIKARVGQTIGINLIVG